MGVNPQLRTLKFGDLESWKAEAEKRLLELELGKDDSVSEQKSERRSIQGATLWRETGKASSHTALEMP